MPVVDQTGRQRGYVPFDAVAGLGDFGNYPKGVVPVTDDSGKVVGYVGPYVGFIEKATVDAADFNLESYVARNGAPLNQDQRDRLKAISTTPTTG